MRKSVEKNLLSIILQNCYLDLSLRILIWKINENKLEWGGNRGGMLEGEGCIRSTYYSASHIFHDAQPAVPMVQKKILWRLMT